MALKQARTHLAPRRIVINHLPIYIFVLCAAQGGSKGRRGRRPSARGGRVLVKLSAAAELLALLVIALVAFFAVGSSVLFRV